MALGLGLLFKLLLILLFISNFLIIIIIIIIIISIIVIIIVIIIIIIIIIYYYVAKGNLGQVYLELMCPAVSMISGRAAEACLATCLHVSTSCHICSCLLSWP